MTIPENQKRKARSAPTSNFIAVGRDGKAKIGQQKAVAHPAAKGRRRGLRSTPSSAPAAGADVIKVERAGAFCYYDAAINKLTKAALDPFGKIPEFKYWVIRLTAGGPAPVQSSYGGGQALQEQTSEPFFRYSCEGEAMMKFRPVLSNAWAALTHDVEVLDERGRLSTIAIPAERPLTVYVDKRELVTLMTLGGAPEALTLGSLRNQRLVKSIEDVLSVQVDWSVDAVAVTTRSGIAGIEEHTSKKVVTPGCGQGSVFGAASLAENAHPAAVFPCN